MSNLATLPMSMASVGYALFALQQSVTLDHLQPIQFHVSGPQVVGEFQHAVLPAPSGSTAEFDPTAGLVRVPVGEPLAPVEFLNPDDAPVFTPQEFDPSKYIQPAAAGGAAVFDPQAGMPTQAPTPVAPAPETTVPAQPAEDFSDVFVPSNKVIPVAADDQPKQAGAPRASVQIGLLRELSFLDS